VQILTFRAGSAGGPKPGRAGFYLELAALVHSATPINSFATLGIRNWHDEKNFAFNARNIRRRATHNHSTHRYLEDIRQEYALIPASLENS